MALLCSRCVESQPAEDKPADMTPHAVMSESECEQNCGSPGCSELLQRGDWAELVDKILRDATGIGLLDSFPRTAGGPAKNVSCEQSLGNGLSVCRWAGWCLNQGQADKLRWSPRKDLCAMSRRAWWWLVPWCPTPAQDQPTEWHDIVLWRASQALLDGVVQAMACLRVFRHAVVILVADSAEPRI